MSCVLNGVAQHCTLLCPPASKQKKKTYLTLLSSVTRYFCYFRMPFPRSVVLHFPAEIHRTQGVSEVAPQLLRALDVEKIAAVQFLRNGRVRVTTKTSHYRDELLEGSTFLFGDFPIQVTAAYQPLRSVFVRDLPDEVSDVDVNSVFESFGVVHSVRPCFFSRVPVRWQWYPSSCNVIPWFHSVVCVRA